MTQKLYRTIIAYEVLSDRAIDNMELIDIARECYEGDFSGSTIAEVSGMVTTEKMVALCEAQGSEAEFILGEDLEDLGLDEDAIQKARLRRERDNETIKDAIHFVVNPATNDA